MATTCEIQADDSGWYVLCDGNAIASGFVSCGDAIDEATAQGLTILNATDVERWMQPPGDWGIKE